MRVLYCHRFSEPVDGGHRCLATIDFELNQHIRLYGIRLMQMRDGRHLIFAPQSGQRRTATLSTPFAERLTDLALAAYREVAA